MILAAAGVLLGLGGMALAGYAHFSTKAAIGDVHARVHRQLPETSGLDARAIRDVAVVRYDALEEMSGARSFSLALLNAAGNGVVVTSINGRTESRTYAKTISGGDATEALSPEEYRAIRSARMGDGPTAPADADDDPAVHPLARDEGNTVVQQQADVSASTNTVRPLGNTAGATTGQREVPETAR